MRWMRSKIEFVFAVDSSPCIFDFVSLLCLDATGTATVRASRRRPTRAPYVLLTLPRRHQSERPPAMDSNRRRRADIRILGSLRCMAKRCVALEHLSEP